ncbi:MAG: hypothetical protein E7661_03930 [Ruminococcaceae bacterium]|nr:hypothetical protein [Oscillospiraceae bacterium]
MNFKSRIARFFYGRYGADQLYNFLFITQIVLLFLGAVFSVLGMVSDVFSYLSFALYVIAFGLFIWTLFRCLSRNIVKRRKENMAFLRLKSKLFHRRAAGRPADTAEYVFRNCPKCKSVLRLPRRVGKHTAKCPRCENRFKVKVRK